MVNFSTNNYLVYKLTEMQVRIYEKLTDNRAAYWSSFPKECDKKGWNDKFNPWIPPSYREGIGLFDQCKNFNKLVETNSPDLENIPQNAYQWHLQEHNLPEGSAIPNPEYQNATKHSLLAIRVLLPVKYYIGVVESIVRIPFGCLSLAFSVVCEALNACRILPGPLLEKMNGIHEKIGNPLLNIAFLIQNLFTAIYYTFMLPFLNVKYKNIEECYARSSRDLGEMNNSSVPWWNVYADFSSQ